MSWSSLRAIFLSFVISVLFFSTVSVTSGAEKKAVPDSVLFQMSMELYDSISTPSFTKMYREGLKLADEAGNESR